MNLDLSVQQCFFLSIGLELSGLNAEKLSQLYSQENVSINDRNWAIILIHNCPKSDIRDRTQILYLIIHFTRGEIREHYEQQLQSIS